MKMIWPGRALGVALLVPALAVAGAARQRVGLAARAGARRGGRDGGTCRPGDARRARAGCASSGTWARVCSLNEPQDVELVSKTLAAAARSMRLRDDVPDEFSAEPAAFDVAVPRRAPGHPLLPVRAQEARNLCVRAGGRARRQPPGFLARAILVAAAHRGSRLSRYSSGRAVHDAGAARPALDDGRAAVAAAGNGQRVRAAARLHRRGRSCATSTGGRRPGDSKLTSRAFQHNQSQRIIFLIDCGRLMAGDTGDGLSPLDHAFNAMLLLAHVALIRGDQVGLLAFSDRVRAYVAPGGGPRRINRLVHSVHNIFPEMVEPRYDRAFIELEQRCRKRSLVVLMTNLFDDLSAQLAGVYLRNLTGRHLPLGVFLRDHDLFAVADSAPDAGSWALPGGGGGGALELARARPGRPAALGRLDPRRVSRRIDGGAGQSLPRNQGAAPALTPNVSLSRAFWRSTDGPISAARRPGLRQSLRPAAIVVRARAAARDPAGMPFTVADVFNWSWAIFKERMGQCMVIFWGAFRVSIWASAWA